MDLKTFPQGIHPSDSKELTRELPINNMPVPQKVVIPLSQHIGAPAMPVVSVSDHVRTGQKIGEAAGFISAAVHSSISGKVTRIEDALTPLGIRTKCVYIESDGKDEWIDQKKRDNFHDLSKKQMLEMISESGIVGLGGATFPTAVKLSPPPDKKIDCLIINSAGCEPYLTCDYRLMIERTMDTIQGIRIMLKILEIDKAYIGIEANKMGAYNAYRKMLQNVPEIEPVMLQTKYPQGAEKSLIKAVLGREVPSGGLPMDIGVVVQNTGTVLAVYEAVMKSRPLVERVLTVTGYGVRQPQNLLVRIGTSFEEVINFCGGFVDEPGKVLMGGPMMGFAQYDISVPVVKGTSGILVIPRDSVVEYEENPCLRCAKCVDVCPQFLIPSELAKLSKKYLWDKAAETGAMDCVECGSCSYVCPSKINLVQYIKLSKNELIKRRSR
ncbi:MAG: electron transport complex subunit RsxC [Candidatus Muiribacteriaceae bacterium]